MSVGDDFCFLSNHKHFQPLDSVRPLRLPTIGEEMTSFEDQTLEMASWGIYSDEHVTSDNLRMVEMEIISAEECAKTYPPPLITSFVLCSRASHCSGDSGSMLVERNSRGEFLAVGIASFSIGKCNETFVNPSVFMRIASYLDFIRGTLDLIDD